MAVVQRQNWVDFGIQRLAFGIIWLTPYRQGSVPAARPDVSLGGLAIHPPPACLKTADNGVERIFLYLTSTLV